jgi:hypothetical protein
MVDRGKLGIDKDLSYLDPRIRAQPPSARLVMLPADYTPGYWDVICQGGKENYHHSESSSSIYLVVCVLLLSYDSALSM